MTEDSRSAMLRQLLDEGWTYHDSDSERLARELEATPSAGVDPDLLVPFLHLSTHTIGEHLADWPRALRLGRRLLDGRTATAETAKAWGRLQVAAVLAGDAIAAVDLELSYLEAVGSDVGAALLDMRFVLVGALAGSKHVVEAARLHDTAVALLERIPSADFLERTVAAVSNNLGWDLYETARSPELDLAMRRCADTGLVYWRRCGNWINEERALYFRALVANVLGDPRSALADADEALAVIDAHGPRPLDAALLHLARAAALRLSGDDGATSCAIADADAAASALTAADLQARFAAERARVLAAA